MCWSTHCVSAATNGQLEALKYCRLELKLPLAADCFSEAMRGGHREVAEWLKDQGCPVRMGAPHDIRYGGHWVTRDDNGWTDEGEIFGVRRDDGRGGLIEGEGAMHRMRGREREAGEAAALEEFLAVEDK